MKRVKINILIRIQKNILPMGMKHVTKSRQRRVGRQHFGPGRVKQSSCDGKLRS